MFCQLLLLVLQVSFSVWTPFCCASIFLFFSFLKIIFKTLFCFTFVHTFSPIQSQCWRFCFVHYFFDIFPRVSLDFSKLFTATFVNIVVANNFFLLLSNAIGKSNKSWVEFIRKESNSWLSTIVRGSSNPFHRFHSCSAVQFESMVNIWFTAISNAVCSKMHNCNWLCGQISNFFSQ